MKGSVSHHLETSLPAGEVWEVYGSICLAELVVELLPNIIPKIDLIEGNGGVGTVLKVHYSPDTLGPPYRIEKFIKIDNENRMKDVEMIEGGYLELGFTSLLFRIEIIEKEGGSSIIKTIIEYEIKDELAENISFVTTSPFADMVETISKYLVEKKASAPST